MFRSSRSDCRDSERRDSLEGAYVEDSTVVDSPVEEDNIPEAEDSLVRILEEDNRRMPVVVLGGDNSLLAEILYYCTDPYPLEIDESVDVCRRNVETKPNWLQ